MIAEAVAAPVIRQATTEDAVDLLVLLRRLVDTSRYTQETVFNEVHVAGVVDALLANPDAGLFVAEDDGGLVGVIGLVQYDDMISGECLAAEVFWYVDPAYRNGVGVTLLSTAEQWAASRGVRRMQMMEAEQKFASFFARHGYEPRHRMWERSL